MAERRSSSTRASHEAEIDDILNVIEILDLQSEFGCLKFVASNLDNRECCCAGVAQKLSGSYN